MILFPPLGGINFDGATFSSPERAVFVTPDDGTWTVQIDGFTVFDRLDDDGDSDSDSDGPTESKWVLRVTADGQRLWAN